MPLTARDVNVVSGAAPALGTKVSPSPHAPGASVLLDVDEAEAVATDNALATDHSSDAQSPAPLQPHSDSNGHRGDAAVKVDTNREESSLNHASAAASDGRTKAIALEESGDVPIDAEPSPTKMNVSLELQPPPPMSTRAAGDDEDAVSSLTDFGVGRGEDAASPASSSSKAFLLPVVALGSRYDVPVTSSTTLFSVIREVAELAVPPERADALGEVEAILYHDNEPLSPDSTVGELPAGSVLHFHLSANTTAKLSSSLPFFPSQLRSRRATSHVEPGMLPTFRAPGSASWAPFTHAQSSHAGPALANMSGQSMLGTTTHVTSNQRSSLATSAPFYIGGNVSIAPSAARRRSSSATTAAASRGVPPPEETVGTTCWEASDGSPCYTSIQVETQRVPIHDTRDCPPPAHPDRLPHGGSPQRLRSIRAPTWTGGGASSVMPPFALPRGSIAHSAAPPSAWNSPNWHSASLPPSASVMLPFQALQPSLARVHSTVSAPSMLVAGPAEASTQPHARAPSRAVAAAVEARAPSKSSSLALASLSEELKERADRLVDSTTNDDQFSIVYVHLPSTTANAFGEEPASKGAAKQERKPAQLSPAAAATLAKYTGRLGDTAVPAEKTSLVPPSSPQRSEMRRLRLDRTFPVGTLREMFNIPARLSLYAGCDLIENERQCMNELHLEGYTVFSFTNNRPSSALIAAPYLNSPVASPPPPAALGRQSPAAQGPNFPVAMQSKVFSLSDFSHPSRANTFSITPSSSASAATSGLYAVMPSAGAYWSAAPAIQPVLVAGSDGRLINMAPLRLEQAQPSLVLSPLQAPISVASSVIGDEDDLFSTGDFELRDELSPQASSKPRRETGHTPDRLLWASTTLSSHRRSSANPIAQNTTQPFMADSTGSTMVEGEGAARIARRSTISAVLQDAQDAPTESTMDAVQRFTFPTSVTSPTAGRGDSAALTNAPRSHSRHQLAPLEAAVPTTHTHPHMDNTDAPPMHRAEDRSPKAARHSLKSGSLGAKGGACPPRTLEPLSATQEPTQTTTLSRGSSLSRLASGSLKHVKDSFRKLKAHRRSSSSAETPSAADVAPEQRRQTTTETALPRAAAPLPHVQTDAVAASSQNAPRDTGRAGATSPLSPGARVSFHGVPQGGLVDLRNDSFPSSSDGENGVIDINNISSASADCPSARSIDGVVDAPAPVRIVSATGVSTPLTPSLHTPRSSSTASRHPTPLNPEHLAPRPSPATTQHYQQGHTCGARKLQATTSTPPRKRSDTLAPDQVKPLRSIEVGSGHTTPRTRGSSPQHAESEPPTRTATPGKQSAKEKKKAKKSKTGGKSPRWGTAPLEMVTPAFLRKKSHSPSAATPSTTTATGPSNAKDVAPQGSEEVGPRTPGGRHARVKRRVPSVSAKEVGHTVKNEGSAITAPRRQSYAATSVTSFDGDELDKNAAVASQHTAGAADANTTQGARLVRKGSGLRRDSVSDRYANASESPSKTSGPVGPSSTPDISVSAGPVTLSRTFEPGTLPSAGATDGGANKKAHKAEGSHAPVPVPVTVPVGKRDSDSSAHGNHNAASAQPGRWEATPSPTSILVPTRQYNNTNSGSPSSSAAPAKYMTRSNSFRRNTQQSPQLRPGGSPGAPSSVPHGTTSSSPQRSQSPSQRSPHPQDRRSGSGSHNSSGSLTSLDRTARAPAGGEANTVSPSNSSQRFSVDSTSTNGRIRISLCDPMDNSKINFGVPVMAECPVGVLREWLREEVTARFSGKNVPIPRFQNRLEYGVFCGDARVIDDAVLTFAEATGGKNDCVFSLRKLVDDRTAGLAQYGSFNGIAQRHSSSP